MHPELYQVIYRQQEREREVLLHRRMLAAERAGTAPVRSRRAGRPGLRWFGIAWFAGRRSNPEYGPAQPCVPA
jgi:hypothetical protein